MPREILTASEIDPSPQVVLLLQLYAAVLFSWSMVNWTARGTLIGGIYNRPVAIGNLTHFTIGALALVKAFAGGAGGVLVVALVTVYAAFAATFAIVFVTTPGSVTQDGRFKR